MKKIFFALLVAGLITGCNSVTYTTITRSTAKQMVLHYTSTTEGVSHNFDDLIKFFRIDTKALRKVEKAGNAIRFLDAAYLASDPRVGMANKPTVILQVMSKNDTTFIDIRDIHYAHESKMGSMQTDAQKPPPVQLCPPPPDCIVPYWD